MTKFMYLSDVCLCSSVVIKFAEKTGVLQTLSDVNLKLIAINHMLEAEIHGTKHIRDIGYVSSYAYG